MVRIQCALEVGDGRWSDGLVDFCVLQFPTIERQFCTGYSIPVLRGG